MPDESTGVKTLWSVDRDAKRVAAVMMFALFAGGVVVWFSMDGTSERMTGLLWSAAWSSIGWFLGFLFGIPRFLSTDTARTPAAQDLLNAKRGFDTATGNLSISRAEASKANDLLSTAQNDASDASKTPAERAQATANIPTAADAVEAASKKLKSDEEALETARKSLDAANAKPAVTTGASVTVNTNLEQISDWLTKIIVGVALVETKELITQMNDAAEFMSDSLGDSSLTSIAMAIILYFLVSGLLGSYLLTRLFLQGALANAAKEHGPQ